MSKGVHHEFQAGAGHDDHGGSSDRSFGFVFAAVFALIGQVVYFRIAQPLVRRRMGWTRIGPDEAARIADSLAAGLAAELERQRR